MKSFKINNLAKILGTLYALGACSVVSAAGYKIPEASLNSTALSAAYVASAEGADASYYNPANMVDNEDRLQAEMALTYIGLSDINYKDNNSALIGSTILDGKSEKEQFLMPTLHTSLGKVQNLNLGFSMVSPGGLTKRWKDPVQKSSAEEFSLTTVELNPTAAYKVNNKLSIGGGLRMIYAEGVVKSETPAPTDPAPLTSASVKRDMEGDTISYGYNLALSYKPSPELAIGLTYRSNVDLDVEGTAKLTDATGSNYSGGASVSIPIPASLNLAFAYTVLDKTTVELVYERTYWSEYDELDFNYDRTLTAADGYIAAFEPSIPKNWEDSNTFRLGLSHNYNNQLKLMFGYARDETPIPGNTLGFELPGSDGNIYSAGFEYKLNDAQSLGMSYLYTTRDARSVTNSGVDGTFTNSNVFLATIAYKHAF